MGTILLEILGIIILIAVLRKVSDWLATSRFVLKPTPKRSKALDDFMSDDEYDFMSPDLSKNPGQTNWH